MGGRETCGVFNGDKGIRWSVHISSIRGNNDLKDKLTGFIGDLQETRVTDPRLEAMASKPPIELRSMRVPSEISDCGSSKLPNLGRGSYESSRWLTGRAPVMVLEN